MAVIVFNIGVIVTVHIWLVPACSQQHYLINLRFPY